MKSSKLICLFLFLAFSLSAQLRLDVAGDARIIGQLDLSSPGNNMFIGAESGESITTGQFNTFMGQAAGAFNTEGESNTFFGLLSGYSNSTGKENTIMGVAAGLSNVTGSFNTFLGMDAGRNSTNSRNTFIGSSAGLGNTSGQSNVFVGRTAGAGNTTGSGNTLVGESTGSRIGYTGSFNTFLGQETGRDNKSGDRNTFLGTTAGYQNDSGQYNTFVGLQSGGFNTTGSFNTFVGGFAGNANETGDNLIAIGYNASANPLANGPIEDAFAIGGNTIMLQSHSGVIGNIGIQRLSSYVNWSTASDGRMKTNVRENIQGLDFILQLRAVSYQVDAIKLDKFLRQGGEQVQTDNAKPSAEEKSNANAQQRIYQGTLQEKSNVRYTGFIAQEVEKAMNTSGFEFSGLVKPAHDQDHYSLRYAEFVVPLVKAIQEQQELIQTQQQKMNQLQTEVTDLKVLVQQLLAN